MFVEAVGMPVVEAVGMLVVEAAGMPVVGVAGMPVAEAVGTLVVCIPVAVYYRNCHNWGTAFVVSSVASDKLIESLTVKLGTVNTLQVD